MAVFQFPTGLRMQGSRSLGDIFESAQQYRLNREEARDRKEQRKATLEELRLGREAKMQEAEQRRKDAESDRRGKLAEEETLFKDRVSKMLDQSPNNASGIMDMARKIASAKGFDPAMFDEQMAPGIAGPPGNIDQQQLEAQSRLEGAPQEKPARDVNAIASEAANSLGLVDVQQAMQHPQWVQAFERARAEAGKRGATSIVMGGQSPIESSTKGAIEKEILSNDRIVSEIDNVVNLARSASGGAVGVSGGVNRALGSAADYWGAPVKTIMGAVGIDPEKKIGLMRERQRLETAARNVGDMVLRSRTGAAAPAGEKAEIGKIMGNIDTMGREQLIEAMTAFRAFMVRNSEVNRGAISGGIAVPPGARQDRRETIRDLLKANPNLTDEEAVQELRRLEQR